MNGSKTSKEKNMCKTKFLKYDVVVVGGGSAGVAAAIGAAQTGASTLLIDRNPYLGGEATHSILPAYCGFFTQTNPPEQIVGGVGNLVLEQLAKMGKYDAPYRSAMGNAIVLLDPEAVKYALDICMDEAKVEYLLHTQMIGVEKNADKITSIECVDDSGRFTIQASAFVDATGEANLTALAGGPTLFGDEDGTIQIGTLSLRIGGVKPDVDISVKNIKAAILQAKAEGMGPLTKESGIIIRIPGLSDILTILPSAKVNGIDAASLTDSEKYVRKQAHVYINAFRKYLPGFEQAYLIQTGPKIGIRETRRIRGEYTLSADDVFQVRRFDNAIARGSWPVEIHKDPEKMAEYTHLKDNSYFDIPIGTLKVKEIQNLWAAGRIISSDPTAYGSIRVMGTGFATGHAAGVAAALTIGKDSYDVHLIRSELLRQKAII